MSSLLPTNEEKIEFVETEAWPYLRPIFIFGRIFGSSYISANKHHRLILKIYCALSGLFGAFILCRCCLFFKDNPTNELNSEQVFKTIFLCVSIFGQICWGSSLYVQSHINDSYPIINRLIRNGYKRPSSIHIKGQVAKQLITSTLVVLANFTIMLLAGLKFIPFAFYPYYYNFLSSDTWFLALQTSITTFFITGCQYFGTTLHLLHLFFSRSFIQQFNERLADPNFRNSNQLYSERLADPNLSKTNELYSEYFLICKLKEDINRMWSVTIFLYDALFIILLVVVAFSLVTQKEIATDTKIVLVFWILVFFSFFSMLNVPAILLNEESEKSMSKIFQRIWMMRETKLFQMVRFFAVLLTFEILKIF